MSNFANANAAAAASAFSFIHDGAAATSCTLAGIFLLRRRGFWYFGPATASTL